MTAALAALPAGRIDMHMHVYSGDPGPSAPFRVPHATVEAYRKVMEALDIRRVVVVQSMLYGADNTVMLQALSRLGRPHARGIAVTLPDSPEAEWDRLGAQGVIGLRAFMLKGGILDWSGLPRLCGRLAERDWQLHLQCDGNDLAERFGILDALPCRLVVDHVGKFLTPVEETHPAFRALQRLVDGGRTWVKISGLYETSRQGPPDYDDVAALARALIRQAPSRMVWASNWPHPNHPGRADDIALALLAQRLAEDPGTIQALFHDNAAALADFASLPSEAAT